MVSILFPKSPTWRKVWKQWCSEAPPSREDVLEALSSGEPVPGFAKDVAAWLIKKHSPGRTPLTPWQQMNKGLRVWAQNHEVSRISAELKDEGVRNHRDEAVRTVSSRYNFVRESVQGNITRQLPDSYKAK